MLTAINLALMLATLASAFALYAIKYDTRRLEARVQAQERALEKSESDVTVLTAERAHLARPERLEPLARLIGLAAHRQPPNTCASRGGAASRPRKRDTASVDAAMGKAHDRARRRRCALLPTQTSRRRARRACARALALVLCGVLLASP